MAYRVPTFPLFCNIWRGGPIFPGGPPAVISICQLRMAKSAFIVSTGNTLYGGKQLLMLPKLTDIRGNLLGSPNGDYVEVPAGSGIRWIALAVGDVAKGFPNEYRAAALVNTTSFYPRP